MENISAGYIWAVFLVDKLLIILYIVLRHFEQHTLCSLGGRRPDV